MDALRCIVYVSSAVKLMSEAELEALLVEARDLNLESHTTGVLLYAEGTFFQYFEGSDEAVALTYRRIKDSRRHTGIVELMNERIEERCFADWQMGFAHAMHSEVIVLSTARWQGRVDASPAAAGNCAGLALLLDFWSRSAR